MSFNVDHPKHFLKEEIPGNKRNLCTWSVYLVCLLPSQLPIAGTHPQQCSYIYAGILWRACWICPSSVYCEKMMRVEALCLSRRLRTTRDKTNTLYGMDLTVDFPQNKLAETGDRLESSRRDIFPYRRTSMYVSVCAFPVVGKIILKLVRGGVLSYHTGDITCRARHWLIQSVATRLSSKSTSICTRYLFS